MISSLDITRILSESERQVVEGKIIGVEYYRKERALQVYIKTDRRYCLTQSFHPQRSGFFILPAGRSRLDTKEKYRPFAREIWGGTVIGIRQIPNDRIIEIDISQDDSRWTMVFEIIGPNGNILLLDDKRIIRATLRNKKGIENQPYQLSKLPEKLDPFSITEKDIQNILQQATDMNPVRLLEKQLYGFDYYLAQKAVGDTPDPQTIAENITTIVNAYQSSDGPIYAYRIKGKILCYPVKLSSLEFFEKYKSLSLAQRDIVIESKADDDEANYRELTLKSIKNRIKKAERLLRKLDADIAEAADYDRYLQFANLLKIHLSKLKRGMKSISVPDLYAEDTTVEIPLDEKLTGPENIEKYSRRYRKGKEGLELLTRRKENVNEETAFLREALDLFENDFERAKSYYPELLPTITDGRPTETVTRKPYKEYQTSTGLTIFVGKTGSDNDRTTFEYARPYELWFHASQCPGSHVIMKFPHKNFEPSIREIEETAAAAAWASKARGSAKVPVNYTQRKYVRKPRKAKPGLVTIEREKTIIVEPRELEKR